MKKRTAEEKLQELLDKQEKLKRQIASVEARKRKDEDRVLTRKKILVGAHILEKYQTNETAMQSLLHELDRFLTRPHDRKLFGLTLKPE